MTTTSSILAILVALTSGVVIGMEARQVYNTNHIQSSSELSQLESATSRLSKEKTTATVTIPLIFKTKAIAVVFLQQCNGELSYDVECQKDILQIADSILQQLRIKDRTLVRMKTEGPYSDMVYYWEPKEQSR